MQPSIIDHHSLTRPLLALDDDGFLLTPKEWNITIAQQLAQMEWIPELNAEHLRAIQFVRDYYFQFGAPPSMRRVCRALALSPYKKYNLFSVCLQLWRIAGLPNPGEEAKAHIN